MSLALASSAAAQPAQDPDWPCVQRLVPELAAAQLWSGPSLDTVEGFWQADAEIAPLGRELIDLSRPMATVREDIDEFVSGVAPEDRENRLTMLFQAVLESVNGERAQVIRSIKGYARKQKALAERIAQDNAKLEGIRLDVEPDQQPPELLEIRERRDWDLRVFDDRFSMLTPICDQPVLLEQRAFALARAIQEHL